MLIGFCLRLLSGLDGVLGGVLGCVASLLANTKKQNEVIRNPLTEEPDREEDTNIDTYEENEDLEGDGFILKL